LLCSANTVSETLVKCCPGRRVWSKSWCQVSHQVDSSRGCQLQPFHNQVRCMVIRHSYHRDSYLRPTAIPRYSASVC